MNTKKIGITGTKGKTTTMFILKHCLSSLDLNVISVSSTEGMHYNNQYIKNAIANNYFDTNGLQHDFFLSEATSFMLANKCYDNEIQTMAIYTGIEEHEHTEIHPTFNHYLAAKKKLFDLTKTEGIGIVNSDDKYYRDVVRNFHGKLIRVGFKTIDSDCHIHITQTDADVGTVFTLDYDDQQFNFKTKLFGTYNVKNLVMAFIACYELGFNSKHITKHIETFDGVEGRFQKIPIKDSPKIDIIIDYAHTDASLKNILELINQLYPGRHITTVFGCGGNKSKEKRPLMGKYASELSDLVILTNDNPRQEDPNEIILDITQGIVKKKVVDKGKFTIERGNYTIILDRKSAIKKAITTSFNNSKDCVILLAGKGSEKYMLIGNKRIDQSDYDLVGKALSETKL